LKKPTPTPTIFPFASDGVKPSWPTLRSTPAE
jgi:hypothetical protein